MVYALGIVAEGVSRLLFEWRLGQLSVTHFPGEAHPVEEREKQRLAVIDRSDKLADAINAQLKRLRIERMLALSSAIATVAFVIRTDWGWFVGMLLLTCVAVRLVEERFTRYIETIVKASFSALRPLEIAAEPTGVTTSTVIFDLDGVLVDSEPLWREGFRAAVDVIASSLGTTAPSLSDDDLREYEGGRVPDTVATLAAAVFE